MTEKPNNRFPGKTHPAHQIAGLLGLGLDNNDGRKRITRGEKFLLVGGSENTHDHMTETTLKTLEEIKRRNKRLETLDPRELAEIIHKSTPS